MDKNNKVDIIERYNQYIPQRLLNHSGSGEEGKHLTVIEW